MRQNGRGNVSINEKREKKLPVSFILSIVKPRLTISVFSIIFHTAKIAGANESKAKYGE